ncbi:MAG: Gfo/Idh/MocA family oxidoreductase [Sterolibacterium sp.]
MKFLVVGLGSMGKRRVRNLQALDVATIAGFDVRDDRVKEATERYGIRGYQNFSLALEEFAPDALVISTGPAEHMDYAWTAFQHRIPCFIEASVVHADRILALHQAAEEKGVIMAPSCTMRYFPGPRKVKELIAAGAIGKPLYFNYQTGQYLPDWHPWENVADYYVSRRETGGCREIVPFELAWLNDVFGEPEPLALVKAKLGDIDADIDDVYHCLLRFPGGVIGNMTVDVLSRPTSTRELRIIGSEGQIVFSADSKEVRHIRLGADDWIHHHLAEGTVEAQYINPEEPYIAEMADFIAAARECRQDRFPNTLLDDYKVLNILQRLETLCPTK